MPRIRCLYADCNFLDNNYCTAISVEIDPDLGCASYVPVGEADVDVLGDEWDDEEDNYDEWDAEDVDLDDDEDFEEDEEDDW